VAWAIGCFESVEATWEKGGEGRRDGGVCRTACCSVFVLGYRGEGVRGFRGENGEKDEACLLGSGGVGG